PATLEGAKTPLSEPIFSPLPFQQAWLRLKWVCRWVWACGPVDIGSLRVAKLLILVRIGHVTKVTWLQAFPPHTMQENSHRTENEVMQGIGVAVLSEDREHLNVLQSRLDSTNLGRTIFTNFGFPTSATDPILRQIQDHHAEVALVDINPSHPQS